MTAIEFENIGKQYRLGMVSTRTISHDLNRWWTVNVRHREDPYLKIGEINDRSVKGVSEYVWALRDVNFRVEQGDVVGIIGRNGAGKSTLLKLLSRVTGPTTGCIRAKGRLGSLLEVGTGFHPEMTGRENIYLNGAILGMSRAEVAAKLDEIVDFSGCERYLDTPVKRYSSGMMVRLGFAVAAHLDPEILVVDEVLAVGDAEFQKKAIGKMKDVSQGEGRTVLFVSHNMASMQRLCKTGILLDRGTVKYSGTIGDTIKEYLKDDVVQSSFEGIDGCEDIVYMASAKVYSDSADGVIYNNSTVTIEFVVSVRQEFRQFVCGFNIFSSYNSPLARADYNDRSQLQNLGKGDYRLIFKIPPYTFANGEYRIVFDIAEKNVKNYATEKSILTFNVQQGFDGFGNVFSECSPIKESIIHPDWLYELEKL